MLVLVQGGLYKALKFWMLWKCWVNLSAGKCNFNPGCRHSCGTQLSGWGQSQEKMVSEAFRSLPLLYYMRTSDSSEVWATCCPLLHWIKSVTHRVLNLGLHLLWKCRVWSLPLQSVRRCKHSDSHCSIPGLHWMQHPLQPNPHHEHPARFPTSLSEKNGHRRAEVFPNHEPLSVFICCWVDFNEISSKSCSGHSVLLQRAMQPASPELQLSNFPGTWKGNAW